MLQVCVQDVIFQVMKTLNLMLILRELMMMLMTGVTVEMIMVKAAMLTIEDTGVAHPSLTAPGLVNTLVLVRLAVGLAAGQAGALVVGGGGGAVQVRAGEGDKVPVGHVNTTLLVLADAVCVGRLLADEDDVAVLASHHVTALGG